MGGAQGVRDLLRRQVPGLAWRDQRLTQRAEQVAELRGRLQEAERALAEARAGLPTGPGGTLPGPVSPPSFRRHMHDLRRGVAELAVLDPGATHPLRQVPRKLRNHRLAASHGVAVPQILAVWDGPDHLDLSGLPDEFVIKSDTGAGGRGVMPLQRLGPDSYRVVGEDTALTGAHVEQRCRTSTPGDIPVFAEGMLRRPGVEGLPDDIKIYAFYGEVGQVLLRRMGRHGDLRQARYRFLDGHGEDLGPDASATHRIDSSIPAPGRLDIYLDIARHLSLAMGLPFVRVDLYETAAGPVFGELTRGPGGPQRYRADHDEAMGLLWDRAQYRLDLDVVAGRPLANLHGEHPAVDRYPHGHPTAAVSWPAVTSPCSWCRR